MAADPVHRRGDSNTAQGQALGGIDSVLVNYQPIVVDGTGVSPHSPFLPPHLSAQTANGLKNVIANYIPVNVRGNPDTCAHPRDAGSPNVIAG